jgi:ubiquinone/menaquinone biosynthesis C-methylase UbiE
MAGEPVWLFDEKKLAGVDYLDQKIADEYENQHSFRNFKEEADKIFESLQLSSESTILDIGCGTGNLSIELAQKCNHVYSSDISEAMIKILDKKIADKEIKNITTASSGFLNYKHSGKPINAIICNVALHHLPDFWKQVALLNFYNLLSDGGKLFLFDVVFGFSPSDYENELNGWLAKMREIAGDKMADETIVHVRDEYSTWDWVMTGILEKAGFNILVNQEMMKNMRAYICTK